MSNLFPAALSRLCFLQWERQNNSAHAICPESGICYLTWQGDCLDVIKLRTLRWGEYLGIARWARYHHQSLKVENLSQVRSDGVEGGGRGCETGNAGSLQKLEKARK